MTHDPDSPSTSPRSEAISRWDDEGGAARTGPQETLPAAAGPNSSQLKELPKEALHLRTPSSRAPRSGER